MYSLRGARTRCRLLSRKPCQLASTRHSPRQQGHAKRSQEDNLPTTSSRSRDNGRCCGRGGSTSSGSTSSPTTKPWTSANTGWIYDDQVIGSRNRSHELPPEPPKNNQTPPNCQSFDRGTGHRSNDTRVNDAESSRCILPTASTIGILAHKNVSEHPIAPLILDDEYP